MKLVLKVRNVSYICIHMDYKNSTRITRNQFSFPSQEALAAIHCKFVIAQKSSQNEYLKAGLIATC